MTSLNGTATSAFDRPRLRCVKHVKRQFAINHLSEKSPEREMEPERVSEMDGALLGRQVSTASSAGSMCVATKVLPRALPRLMAASATSGPCGRESSSGRRMCSVVMGSGRHAARSTRA